MPDITITLTVNQAQRVASSFGPKPAELTQEEWVIKNTKAFYKERVKQAEFSGASNTAYDAAIVQVNSDFGGF